MFTKNHSVQIAWFIIGLLINFYWLPMFPPSLFLGLKQTIIFFFLFFSITQTGIFVPKKSDILSLLKLYTFGALIIFLIHIENSLSYSNFTRIFGPLAICLAYFSVSEKYDVKIPFAKGFVFGIVLNVLYIFFTYFTGTNHAPRSIVGGWATNNPAYFGFTNSHTGLSPMIGAALIFTLFLPGLVQKRKWKIYFVFFLCSGIILTQGEGGIISTVLAFSGLFLISKIKSPNYRGIGIIMSFVLIIFLFLFPPTFVLDHPKLSSTFYEHTASTLVGLQIFQENLLFGVGLENVYESSTYFFEKLEIGRKMTTNSLQPHNPLIQVLAEGGIFLGVLFILLWKKIISLTIRQDCRTTHHTKWISAIIFLYLFAGLFEPWPFISNIFYNFPLYIALIELERNTKKI